MSGASLAVFLTGSAVGTPLTGSALAGLVTYGQIYNDVILSELREAGVDMNNNAAVSRCRPTLSFTHEGIAQDLRCRLRCSMLCLWAWRARSLALLSSREHRLAVSPPQLAQYFPANGLWFSW